MDTNFKPNNMSVIMNIVKLNEFNLLKDDAEKDL